MEIKEKDTIVLRSSPGTRIEIIAKIFEDDRRIFTLTIQKYNPASGPSGRFHFSFVGEEITQLLRFLTNAKRLDFSSAASINVSDSELEDMLLSTQQVHRLVHENIDALSAALSNDVTSQEIISLAYRKRQLSHFERLLNDRTFFLQQCAMQKCGAEAVWQAFFEENPWIFGYGLSYIFLGGLDGGKLERVVKGFDLLGHGRRADAVMRTHALVSSICFVEIKHSDTELLRATEYRPGVWGPSTELTSAISQLQATVAAAVENLRSHFRLMDENGNPTADEIFAMMPRSFLVVGNLSQVTGEHGANSEKFRSFELFRRNVLSPEIVTFDELYHRAKYITETSTSTR